MRQACTQVEVGRQRDSGWVPRWLQSIRRQADMQMDVGWEDRGALVVPQSRANMQMVGAQQTMVGCLYEVGMETDRGTAGEWPDAPGELHRVR